MKSKFVLTVLFCLVMAAASENAAKITLIEGTASVIKKDSKEKRTAKVSMPLHAGDMLQSGQETFVEITYSNGEVARIGENSTVSIVMSAPLKVRTEVLVGKVWVNMKKLTVRGREFEMSSPTATAAIRGTIFNMSSTKDSLTTVSVYDGKVAVGPSGTSSVKDSSIDYKVKEPFEVKGPSEVPGPYEVSLEQWVLVVAGQQIKVRADKKYAAGVFDVKNRDDAFVNKNMALDEKNSMNK